MLSQVEDTKHVVPHYKIVENMWNVYFWVNDVDTLYDDLIKKGAIIDYKIGNKPYGCREFGIQDLDGYYIAFGQEIDQGNS